MSNLARQYRPTDYINHLYQPDIDGYIQIARIEDGNIYAKNYKRINITDAIDEYKGLKDIFITPNTTFNGKRSVRNIRQLTTLFIDIDNREWSFNDIVYEVWDLANKGKIPYPTMTINSGRGCHLYWRIEHAPYQALATWQELEDYLYYQLKDVGADKKATDASRLMRLAKTKNSKNGAECQIVLIDEDTTYSMYKLREKYLQWKPTAFKVVETTKVINNKTSKSNVKQFYTSYSLHIARAEDILKICELRNFHITGYRNMILHCFAYWLGITTRDIDALEKQVHELNNKFTESLKESEVKAILRCISKAIDKFIEYEQGLRSGQVKRVSKGMRDKGGYWYKNETLIERLNITLEEQKHLKTIISEKEKYRRCADDKKAKQKAKRRNKNGLTKKQQELQDLKKQILKLKEQGLSNRAIAKNIKISESKVRTTLKH